MSKFHIYMANCDIPTTGNPTKQSMIATQIAGVITSGASHGDYCLATEVGSNEDLYQVRQNKHLPIATIELDSVTAQEWEDGISATFTSIFNLAGATSNKKFNSRDDLINRYKFKYNK